MKDVFNTIVLFLFALAGMIFYFALALVMLPVAIISVLFVTISEWKEKHDSKISRQS